MQIQDKYKETSNKVMLQLQTTFLHLISGERFYNNLMFLNQKSMTKIGVNKYIY